jgi:uncharacterized HAD superfamily protein
MNPTYQQLSETEADMNDYQATELLFLTSPEFQTVREEYMDLFWESPLYDNALNDFFEQHDS